MKRILLLLGLLIFTVPLHKAQAQFWKKRKTEKRHFAPPKPKIKEESLAAAKPVKKKEVIYPKTVIKNSYRIDVLLPLYLNELVADDKPVNKNYIPEKAITGVNFYEGIKIAADTLFKQGYNLDIHIHDIADPELYPDKIVKNGTLDGTDLLIGAVQSYQIKPFTDYAKAHQINFISILSPADADVTDNPYFTILQPTLITHIKKLRADIFKKYPNQNVLLFYRTNPNVDSTAFRFAYENEENKFTKLPVNKLPSFAQLNTLFDSTRTNIIFIPILDYNYAQSIIEKLNELFPNYRFEVFGLPSWRFISSIKKVNAFPNIGVNYTNPFYYDMSDKYCLDVVKAYKANFSGKITELTLRGYETIMWYAYLLKRYGTIFNEKVQDNNVTFSKYEVETQWTTDNDLLYNENTHYYIYRYQDGSYMITR